MPYFSGRVHSVVLENAAQSYYILRVVLDAVAEAQSPIASTGTANPPKFTGGHGSTGAIPTVRGEIPGIKIAIGTWFGFEGDWVDHDQYGKQITITKAPVVQSWTPEVSRSVLSANGIGDTLSKRIHDHFGDGLPEALDSYDVTVLMAVPGMTEVSAEHVVARWRVAKAYFRTIEFLSAAGIPKNKITQVWSVFKEEAETVLTQNPWALVRIEGITFHQADEVANRLNLDMSNPLRLEGAVLFVTRAQKGMGHLYLSSGEIFAGIQNLIPDATSFLVGQAIKSLHASKQIVLDRKTKPGTIAIYEPWFHHIEEQAAQLLLKRRCDAQMEKNIDGLAAYATALARSGPQATQAGLSDGGNVKAIALGAINDWSQGSSVVLSPAQITGAINALTEPVSVITGKPGSGKTTLLRAVVRILADAQVTFLLMAPTGIAAKRIVSVTGFPAATIHRALGAKGKGDGEEREATYVGVTGASLGTSGADGSGEHWKYEDTPHPADVIVLDEASMCDAHLLYRVLTCTKPTARIIFIGDVAQLPSVGPGNVLRDLIQSDLFPTVRLSEIFRQADTSGIIIAAHAIHDGVVPTVGEQGHKDFVLLPVKHDDDVMAAMLQVAQKLFVTRSHFQVLSPRHGGSVGVTGINSQLRELLNPKHPGVAEMRIGSEIIREDDRIMVVQNNYDLGIYNGDVGKVARIDRKARVVEIKIHGPPIQYVRIPFQDVGEYLRLAYCVTVHKLQGSEVDIVVMPVVNSFGHQLQRNLLYTAITRAKKKVILVGQYEALAKAVHNDRLDARNTLLLERLLNGAGIGVPSP